MFIKLHSHFIRIWLFFFPLEFDASKIPAVITLQPEDTTVCFTAEDVLIDDSLALEQTVSFMLKIDGIEPFDAERVTIDQETVEVFIMDDDSEYGLDWAWLSWMHFERRVSFMQKNLAGNHEMILCEMLRANKFN